ncbi:MULTISPECIES: glycosyltransferase family 2 protein [Rahnella]|jgi:glycosyltransferase involved in cell wall biosynthesis|uniref:glycosyltransferase family 2 protein n=1 Tax=Rahnella TaxID=34037 RepID=UPI0010701C66|nr:MULTISPECIES: glycosyltransferase family 2 protein [Rahnella]MBU9841681.1 glycosyltransferase family 2 protein [Rahnella aceris]MCM2445098.1 glycosyltransferase family 2 protein [Rahnella sp. CG8]MQB53928.1 glycosyltransferase family 2 protein [Rahnella sp. RcJ3]
MQDPEIAVMMCTYNGAPYLLSQLESIENQSVNNVHIYISDDGSSDETCAIARSFIDCSHFEGTLLKGPKRGFVENFMHMVNNEEICAKYYAFSDQDDVWKSDKLERAINWLSEIPEDVPALYCSRTTLTDAEGKIIGASPNYKRPPAFANSILQNIASGNTMVFNHKARELLALAYGAPMVAHDWSLYQIVSGCGGKVFFDTIPTVFYRQHHNNVIGNSMGLGKRIQNFLQAHSGRAAIWNNMNFEVLGRVSRHLTPESAATLHDFKSIRNSSLSMRLKLMKSSGIYHQQAIGYFTTLTYVLLNKI